MPNLTIGFAGIWCYEGPYDDKGTDDLPKVDAALIFDAGHFAALSINGGTHVPVPPAAKIDLTFGLQGGAQTTTAFQDSVPRLGTITRDGVKLDRASSGTIRIPLPPVTIDVFSYFPYEAVYGLDGEIVDGPKCVANATGFVLTLSSLTTLSLLGIPLLIDQDMWILFENLPPEPAMRSVSKTIHSHSIARHPAGSGASPSHLKIHRQVTTAVDDNDIGDVYELPKMQCTDAASGPSAILEHLLSVHPTINLHPECSSSQWP